MSSRCSATPRAVAFPAAPAGQRPSPPARRSAPPAPRSAPPAPGSAHHADPQTDPRAARSVTARNHPGNHAQPRRQHRTRRRNVTSDHTPQYQAQRPECLRSRAAAGFDKGTLAMAQIGLMRSGQKPARSPGKRTGHRPLSNPAAPSADSSPMCLCRPQTYWRLSVSGSTTGTGERRRLSVKAQHRNVAIAT